jgi:hypothetical protein
MWAVIGTGLSVTLRNVWVWAFNLYKTLATYHISAASGIVQVARVCGETNGTVFGVSIEGNLERLSIDERIAGERYLAKREIRLRVVSRGP